LKRILYVLSIAIMLLMMIPGNARAMSSDTVSEGFVVPSAPAKDYEVTIESKSAVYVDEGAPTANLNAIDPNYIRIGESTEFCYQYQTLIRFYPIGESKGGILPDGAVITGAAVRLYKDNNTAGTVNIYGLAGSFDESTVTWNTRPGMFGKGGHPILIGSATLLPTSGWYEINIPEITVENWISSPSTNYGIAVTSSWTSCKYMAFRSDEFASSTNQHLHLHLIQHLAPSPTL